jgi:hypothetical protein
MCNFITKKEVQYFKLKLKVLYNMAEISKEFKIVLTINALAAFIYGFMFLVIPDIYHEISDEPYPNVHLLRLWGGTITLLGIFTLIVVKRGDWESGKLIIQLALAWLLLVGVLSLISFAYVKRSPINVASTISDAIVTLAFFVIDLYFYQRETK